MLVKFNHNELKLYLKSISRYDVIQSVWTINDKVNWTDITFDFREDEIFSVSLFAENTTLNDWFRECLYEEKINFNDYQKYLRKNKLIKISQLYFNI